MPRCCGGAECKCVVSAGDNISVEGVGTSGSPYVVTVDLLSNTALLDFGSIGAGLQAVLTVVVTGAVAGDVVLLGPPAALEAGLSFCGYVSAADTVTVVVANNTAGAIDPAEASWRVSVLK